MGKWASGVTTAQGSDRGEYLGDGVYDAEVVYTDSIPIRNSVKVLTKVRLKILATNNPNLKIGDERDMCFNVDPSNKDAIGLQLADIRGYVMAAENCKQDEVTEETIYYIFDRKNDAHVGKTLRIVATTIKVGKEKTQDFTKYACRPFDAAAHEKLKGATRAA